MLATRRDVIAGLGSILLDCGLGCNRPKPEPVIILIMDPGTRWLQRQQPHLNFPPAEAPLSAEIYTRGDSA